MKEAIRRIQYSIDEVIPASVETQTRQTGEPNDMLYTKKDIEVPGVDNRTVLTLPKGIDSQEMIQALGWFTAAYDELRVVRRLDREIKLTLRLDPEPTPEQLLWVLDQYQTLGEKYNSWEEVFTKPLQLQGMDLIVMLLKQNIELRRCLVNLGGKVYKKEGPNLDNEIPKMPRWVKRVIILWNQFPKK